MTPRDVDALSPEEYDALTRFALAEIRAQERAARRARKGRR
jgi:hypothetical protein